MKILPSNHLLQRHQVNVSGAGTRLSWSGLLLGMVCLSCQPEVKPADDAMLKAQWDSPPQQCMGFDDPVEGIYRTSGDPNPKSGDPCALDGGTAEGGHCNVPCGFTLKGEKIGNKSCECGPGFFVDCSCLPLPSFQDKLPTKVGSCADEEAAPAPDGYSQANNDLFADNMNGEECPTDYAACLTPDLPRRNGEGQCEYTTPKACVCLGGFWQCGSSNGWFVCEGDNCPEEFLAEGVANGDLKTSALCTQ